MTQGSQRTQKWISLEEQEKLTRKMEQIRLQEEARVQAENEKKARLKEEKE